MSSKRSDHFSDAPGKILQKYIDIAIIPLSVKLESLERVC